MKRRRIVRDCVKTLEFSTRDHVPSAPTHFIPAKVARLFKQTFYGHRKSHNVLHHYIGRPDEFLLDVVRFMEQHGIPVLRDNYIFLCSFDTKTDTLIQMYALETGIFGSEVIRSGDLLLIETRFQEIDGERHKLFELLTMEIGQDLMDSRIEKTLFHCKAS